MQVLELILSWIQWNLLFLWTCLSIQHSLSIQTVSMCKDWKKTLIRLSRLSFYCTVPLITHEWNSRDSYDPGSLRSALDLASAQALSYSERCFFPIFYMHVLCDTWGLLYHYQHFLTVSLFLYSSSLRAANQVFPEHKHFRQWNFEIYHTIEHEVRWLFSIVQLQVVLWSSIASKWVWTRLWV